MDANVTAHVIPEFHGAWAMFIHPKNMTCEHCGDPRARAPLEAPVDTRAGATRAARKAIRAERQAKPSIPEAEITDAISAALKDAKRDGAIE